MAALDFPASPSNGQQFTGPGGVLWVYDSTKTAWVSGSLAAGVYITPNTNFADNAGFAINQRVYVSGTALGAAAFGHDRWKGGAGGGTYTFAAPAGPSNTITITAGTLQQVLEGLGIVGGNYMLSWIGTAQGRVGAGSYAASPVAVTGIAAGANTTIEFNAGTLSRVKFEAGTVATPWQALPPQQDLAKCQRFYQTGGIYFAGSGLASNACIQGMALATSMRVSPTTITSNFTTQTNCTGATVAALNSQAVYATALVTATAQTAYLGTFTASADL
jgi:hypothetical protein